MDPLTQGLLGAALPQSASNKRHIVAAGVLGVAAGMAPDLDVLIRSSSDPLLFWNITDTLPIHCCLFLLAVFSVL